MKVKYRQKVMMLEVRIMSTLGGGVVIGRGHRMGADYKGMFYFMKIHYVAHL